MKTAVFTLVIFLFNLQNSFAQPGWVRQTIGISNESSYTFYDAHFINPNTGFIVGTKNNPQQAVFMKTTNSGINWSVSSFPLESFFCLGFIDASTGVISAGYNYRRTTNAGATWTPVTNLSGVWMAKIIFRNSTTGFAFGPNSIDYTNDAGLSWQHSYTLGKIFLNDAVFLTQNKAITVGWNSYSTTNSGLDWVYQSPLYSQYGISNCDSNNIMTCGQYFRCINKSTNGGTNWTIIYSGTESDTTFNAIKYFDVNNAIVAGCGGKILHTSNGGANWNQQTSGVGSTLLRMTFVNSQTGWIVGKNGVILKTTTGGVVTGFTQTSSEVPDKFSLSQNYPNPFNPNTVISYQLPVAGNISLKIYDALGNEIETLVNEKQNAGRYSIDFNASSLPSGIYFYKLTTEIFSETKKMILVK